VEFTDDKYIDGSGGLFIEYYVDNGFYQYIHINTHGKIEFLEEDIIVNGKKCIYYRDYCSSEALTAELKLNDLRDTYKNCVKYYKNQVDKIDDENLNDAIEKDFCYDDIPF
jgi:hypothetical protein